MLSLENPRLVTQLVSLKVDWNPRWSFVVELDSSESRKFRYVSCSILFDVDTLLIVVKDEVRRIYVAALFFKVRYALLPDSICQTAQTFIH